MTFSPPAPIFAPTVDAFKQAGDPDDTLSFTRGYAAGFTRLYGTPGKIYTVNGVVLNGVQFDGRGCIVRDAAGAPFCFQLTGWQPGIWDVLFQDQGNVAKVTTNVGGLAPGATALTVAAGTGLAAGQMVLIQDSATVWDQTQIAGVAGTAVTLNQGAAAAATAGLAVVASFGLVNVTDSYYPTLKDLVFVNCDVGIVLASSADATNIVDPIVENIRVDSSRYCSLAIYRSVHGLALAKATLGNGVTDTFNYTGNNSAGPFSIGYANDLIRDVTVTVAGVAQVYGTAWNFADDTHIQFLAGHFPGVGAAVVINHYHPAVRGMIHDSRGGSSLTPAGNTFENVRALKCMIGFDFNAAQADSYVGLIADTCMMAGVALTNIPNQITFVDLYATWSRTPVQVVNSGQIVLDSLTSSLILAGQFNPYLGVNVEISADATSYVDVNVANWRSVTFTMGGAGNVVLHGGFTFAFNSATQMTAGQSAYLGQSGQVSVNSPIDFVQYNGFILAFFAKVNTAPGVGQSVTFNLIEDANGVPKTLASVVISGTNYSAALAAPVTFDALSWLSVQAVYSAGAATSYPLGYFLRR